MMTKRLEVTIRFTMPVDAGTPEVTTALALAAEGAAAYLAQSQDVRANDVVLVGVSVEHDDEGDAY